MMKRGMGVVLALVGLCLLALPATHSAQAGIDSPLTITKVVLDGNVTAPGGSIDYEITVTNPASNQNTYFLDCVTDDLPDGFTYEPGSGEPFEPEADCEAALAWFVDGDALEPGDSETFDFTADVNEEIAPGCYGNVATAYYFTEEGGGNPVVSQAEPSVTTGQTAFADVEGEDEQPRCGAATVTAPVRTATPTTTATPKATNTVEATVAPATQTPVPPPPPTATATSTGGGVGGVVTGPNTGSGGASPQGDAGLAAALIALGLLAAGSIAVAGLGSGLRRR